MDNARSSSNTSPHTCEKTLDELLPEAMLERFRDRAAGYDAQNRFLTEDFDELREAGYLAAPVPARHGGAGFDLEALVRAQRRLASYAPATALAVNMHLVWVQVARFMHERTAAASSEAGTEAQDEEPGPLDWVLREAAAGEVFAFGISEAANEAVLMDAFSLAEPAGDGGYRITGTKIFTTLSPVWTRLGVHARDNSDPENPRVVFGFLRRESAGVRGPGDGSLGLERGTITHPGTWNPLGMRATQSWTTKLDGVPLDAADVAGTIEPFTPTHPVVLGIFSSFSILTASVYAGIADRSLELARAAAQQPAGDGGTRLDDPDTAARLTGAVLEHRASLDALELLARDIDAKRARDDWFLVLAAARNRVCDEARSAVDVAMRLVGARGFQADAELARLYRDVLAGMFHPSSSRALAKTVRGVLSA